MTRKKNTYKQFLQSIQYLYKTIYLKSKSQAGSRDANHMSQVLEMKAFTIHK